MWLDKLKFLLRAANDPLISSNGDLVMLSALYIRPYKNLWSYVKCKKRDQLSYYSTTRC